MKTEFVRDFKRNYLVICDEQVLHDDYEYKMMTKNNVSGLLPCSERMINGVGYLYYDITSKHSFSQFYADSVIKMDTLQKLFNRIASICEDMEKYLLLDDGLHLSPEYIFLDAETEEYSLLYYKADEDGNNLQELVDFLIERIDCNDIKATEAVYRMADMIARSCYGPDEILKWFIDEFSEDDKILHSNLPQIIGNDSVYNECAHRPIEDETPKNTAKKPKKENKHGFFSWIKSFFSDKEDDDEEVDVYDEYYEEDAPDNIPYSSDNQTVFIPWIENSENKLYGVGKNNKLRIELSKVPLTIGKLRGRVDIVIEDESISRIHAKLTREGNRYYMSDLNSLNGTYRNGMRLNPNETLPIEPGDEIAFGKLKFIYR